MAAATSLLIMDGPDMKYRNKAMIDHNSIMYVK